MSETTFELQAHENRPTGSPVRLKADPELLADVTVSVPVEVNMNDSIYSSSSINGSTLSLYEMLPSVPSDDESGESFDHMVASLLIGMNMQQYIPKFKDADVGLNMFLQLSVEDLEVIGVTDKKDQADLEHGIANIRRRKHDELISRSITGDVADTVVSSQEALPIMCHTVKHINNLVILLRNYRARLDKGQLRNTLIDPKHCAAMGVKILTKEALVQADLLKVQLNGMLAKLEPERPAESPKRNKQFRSKKRYEKTVMHSVLVICSLTLVVTSLAFALQRR